MKKILIVTVLVLALILPVFAENREDPVPQAPDKLYVSPPSQTATVVVPVSVTALTSPVSVTVSAAAASIYSRSTNTAVVAAVVKSLVPVNIQFDLSAVKKIKISWVTTEDASLNYNVLRKLSAEKDFKIINSVPITVTSYVDAAIKTATAYDYKIEAKDNPGKVYASEVKSVSSLGLSLPGKPYTFKTFQDIEQVSIKWSMGTKGSFDISGYNLYRGKTPDKMELYKFFDSQKLKYDDDAVEPAIKYFYMMRTIDMEGYESDPTETEDVIPFPKARTGLVLMSTGFRNNIYDNLGLNVDFIFTYYIGSILSDFQGKGDSLGQISVILFSGDVKGTIFNEFENWPALGLGFTYSVLMQYNLGGSDASGASASFTAKDSITQMYGLYLAASKKIIWDNTLHAGFMSGIGKDTAQTKFMAYLSPNLSLGETGNVKPSNFAYFIGFGRPLWGKVDLKAEIIVPIEANENALFPNYYLINTHLENFLRFDFSYFHFPGGSAFIGYINFRFSIFPNPYK